MATTPDGGDRSITAESLHRDFGELHAVDGVDLEVPGGQIFGFLGPNGAGKSTLVKILTTILNATSGRATVAGYDVAAAGRQGARGDRRRPPGRRPRPPDDGAGAAHAAEPSSSERRATRRARRPSACS